MSQLEEQLHRRRTFAIISHPDAGKTTLTEKLLLFGGAIQLAGTVKGRKAARHATSDWMELEKQRGISVTSSVMQFPYHESIVNLLDTPGHGDFSEDTYRTLTAVDSALMVIDVAKGVEERTIKLMDVCRLRATPILTFVNKLDREGRDAIEVLDEIEQVLQIRCAPVTWPIGMGKRFKGVYDLRHDRTHLFSATHGGKIQTGEVIDGLDNPRMNGCSAIRPTSCAMSSSWCRARAIRWTWMTTWPANRPRCSSARRSTTSASKSCSMPSSSTRRRRCRVQRASGRSSPSEQKFTGFVFKIQANMDPAHRDRVAFLRVCSGSYKKGMKMRHVRIGKSVQVANAITFQADERRQVEEAWPGDIIGLHNHGTIQIGDTFTEGEDLKYEGIPYFAPELFRRVVLKDPLKLKALQKGVLQLCEEGATQVFRPLKNNDIILGAVGVLQFEVAAYRLKGEYGVEAVVEAVGVHTARWVECDDPKMLAALQGKGLSKPGAGWR